MAQLAAGFGMVWIVGHALGAQGLGALGICLLLQGLAPLLVSLGIPVALTQAIRSCQLTEQSALHLALRYCAMALPPSVAALSLLIVYLGDTIFPDVPHLALIAATFGFAANTLNNFFGGILLGTERFYTYSYLNTIRASCNLAAVASAWVANADLTMTVVALTTAQTASTALTATRLRWRQPTVAPKPSLAPLLAYGWKAQATVLANQINYRADVYLVNLLISPLATGVYLLASQIADALATAATSLATLTFARVAGHQDDPHSHKQTIRYCLIGMVATGLIAAPSAWLAEPLIPLFIGAEFAHTYQPLRWLTLGIIVNSGSRILANDIAGRGAPGHNMWSASVAAAINILLNLVLIPPLGLVGAAIATSCAFLIDFCLKVGVFLRLRPKSCQYQSET
ncbi:MAG: polysaccharide biosynthesis C-terminal domain-containing protein [Planctomycetota bacterium]|nr:polysaccharide biosynthesis C-terminal domain-containing protein [Planctomycetota bacterium]